MMNVNLVYALLSAAAADGLADGRLCLLSGFEGWGVDLLGHRVMIALRHCRHRLGVGQHVRHKFLLFFDIFVFDRLV